MGLFHCMALPCQTLLWFLGSYSCIKSFQGACPQFIRCQESVLLYLCSHSSLSSSFLFSDYLISCITTFLPPKFNLKVIGIYSVCLSTKKPPVRNQFHQFDFINFNFCYILKYPQNDPISLSLLSAHTFPLSAHHSDFI